MTVENELKYPETISIMEYLEKLANTVFNQGKDKTHFSERDMELIFAS